ncbi:hypothetical protein DFH09DRAFT_1470690, partial [Mycena vulgaris]
SKYFKLPPRSIANPEKYQSAYGNSACHIYCISYGRLVMSLDSSYFMPAPAPVDLWVVLAILRLSDKYDIQYLYCRALEHLDEDGWYHQVYVDEKEDNLINPGSETPISALSVITATTEVGALWLLPYGNYCVSIYYIHQLLPFLKGDTEEIADILRGTIAVNRFLAIRDPCTTATVCNGIRDTHLSTLLGEVQVGRALNSRSQ